MCTMHFKVKWTEILIVPEKVFLDNYFSIHHNHWLQEWHLLDVVLDSGYLWFM